MVLHHTPLISLNSDAFFTQCNEETRGMVTVNKRQHQLILCNSSAFQSAYNYMPRLIFIHVQHLFYFFSFKIILAPRQNSGIFFCNEHARPEQAIVCRFLAWNRIFYTQILCICVGSYGQAHLLKWKAKSQLQCS